MPAGPHLQCSTCQTNVDTGSDSQLGQHELADDRKTWLISCNHVVCNSCYLGIIHASKARFKCKFCRKRYRPRVMNPQIIYLSDTVPPIMGESRGLQHIADGLLAERNKILREGSELLKRFTELKEQVEQEDNKVIALFEMYGVVGFREGMDAED